MRMHAERQPNVGRDQCTDAAKSIRRHADDGVRRAVNLQSAPDKICAAAHSFPKCETRYYHRRFRVRLRFFGIIKTTEHRSHAHEREEILRSQKRETAFHAFIATDAGD